MRTQFYGIVERANAIIGHFRPVAKAAVLAKSRLGPPLLAKAVFAMRQAGDRAQRAEFDESSASVPVLVLIPAAGFNSPGCAGFNSELLELKPAQPSG